jgi:hypothetical protein
MEHVLNQVWIKDQNWIKRFIKVWFKEKMIEQEDLEASQDLLHGIVAKMT